MAVKLKSLGLGVSVDDDENICILLYADDVVLLADSEADLQIMLNSLHEWCSSNYMTINTNKGNIVHVRSKSVARTNYQLCVARV